MTEPISRSEIIGILRAAEGPMTFEDIYDSTWDEPDPVELQHVLSEMVDQGKLLKNLNEDGITVYNIKEETT